VGSGPATLAVEAYNLAKDERIAEAAVPSLLMVGIALVPLIALSLRIARSRGCGATPVRRS
jgi:iron(III) transport system permease protein